MALPVGGFMPLPLAMMIPFMAGQSMVMGDAFGRAYQYGKRKISAMTNEEFNALTFKGLAEEIFTNYSSIIPSLEKSISMSTKLQTHIIEEMLKMPLETLFGVAGTIKEQAENFQPTLEPSPTGSRSPTNRPTTSTPATKSLQKAMQSDINIVDSEMNAYALVHSQVKPMLKVPRRRLRAAQELERYMIEIRKRATQLGNMHQAYKEKYGSYHKPVKVAVQIRR